LLRPLLVVITDGEANVPMAPGGSVQNDLIKMAGLIRVDRIPVLLVHTDHGNSQSPAMRSLARSMGGVYRQVQRLRAKELTALLQVSRDRKREENL